MTTFPSPTDPVGALTRPDGTTEAHSEDHGRLIGLHENVAYYGAIGNGTTDDSTVFATAIAATPTGGTLYIPPATYIVQGLAVNKNMKIIAPQGAVLKAPNGSTQDIMQVGVTGRTDWFHIEGVTFDANGSTRSGATSAQSLLFGNFGPQFSVVRSCRFQDTQEMAIIGYFSANSVVRIEDCDFSGDVNFATGAYIYFSDPQANVYIDGNRFHGLTGNQCLYGNSGWFSFTNNHVEDCYTGADIRSDGGLIASNHFFTGSNCSGSSSQIDLSGDGATVTNNYIQNDNAANPVYIQGDGHNFIGNRIVSTTEYTAIRMYTTDPSSNVRIANNYFKGSGVSSNANVPIIIESAASSGNLISGNMFDGFTWATRVHASGTPSAYWYDNIVVNPTGALFIGDESSNSLTLPHAAIVLGPASVSTPVNGYFHEFKGQVIATTNGITTKVKAGIPADSDTNIDTDGTLIVDSSNGRLYVRHGGAWHYAALT